MKTIQPINIWNNGADESATILNLTCINDNMFNSAIFYFQLFSETLIELSNGNLTMSLPDYTTDWITNDAAYNWAALQLRLTITGEYVPPVPPIEEITPITE
jgi:hypothetical protein